MLLLYIFLKPRYVYAPIVYIFKTKVRLCSYCVHFENQGVFMLLLYMFLKPGYVYAPVAYVFKTTVSLL